MKIDKLKAVWLLMRSKYYFLFTDKTMMSRSIKDEKDLVSIVSQSVLYAVTITKTLTDAQNIANKVEEKV